MAKDTDYSFLPIDPRVMLDHLRSAYGDDTAGLLLMHTVAVWIANAFDPDDHDGSTELMGRRSFEMGDLIHAYVSNVCRCPKCTKPKH